jgi:glyoxylase-like metal-dependent hydrolase (beta-lactamase superfamily II)
MLRVWSVPGNSQRLDGGAMFGNAPRALWQKWLPPDEQGRVPLACRALLVDTGDKKILLETGIGSFFEPKYKDRYGVVEEEHVLLSSLERLGVSHRDIDFVILSHLHFDHAGGLLAPYVEGEPTKLLFDKATFVVGERALGRARSPHSRDRASFIPEMPELLDSSGRLEVVREGAEGLSALGECFRFSRSDGHTPGMLHTEVVGAKGRVFFCADLIPGVPWLHLPITMGYDRFPEKLIDEKASLYDHALEHRVALFFTHDPDVSAAFLCRDERGRFAAAGSVATLQGWDLDTSIEPA